jgi:hypothetical protein
MNANLKAMKRVQAALNRVDETGFMIPWPRGVYTALKFSTEMLEADVENGDLGVMTHPRQAAELLRLDTVERRVRADAEAHTRGNLQGGTHAQNLRSAVTMLLSLIEAGRENEEMPSARTARFAREAEQAARARGMSHEAAVQVSYQTARDNGMRRA